MTLTHLPRRSSASSLPDRAADLICYSHLRWDFVFQRPNHLMTRAARERRVFFVEEPLRVDEPARLHVSRRPDGVHVVTPRLRAGLDGEFLELTMRQLLDGLCAEYRIEEQIAWYYTPMHIRFSRQFQPLVTVYDVMDELSAFKGAATRMLSVEEELLGRADLVFTGGPSLYEAKRSRHPDVHLFPSAVDHEHFARARGPIEEPEDQTPIARPRIGYFGVVDERIDFELIDAVAALRPDWQFVFVGPIVKVADDRVPRRENLHWMEMRDYRSLPAYISGWDVAIMPFAHNESTRFISPTKGPEYLVAGRPVVSTSIRDVVEPYGRLGLVRIADDPESFVAEIQAAMDEDATERRERADGFLAGTSWDRTWQEMSGHISRVLARSTDDARQVAR